jgi:replicative DNA helicase
VSTDQHEVVTYRRRIEAAAIGGLILQPTALDHVRDWLESTDFETPHYSDWYTHLLAMRANGEPIDQMTLLSTLRRARQLGPQGQHAAELATITMAAPVPASTTTYCRNVLEESLRDQVAAVGVRLTQLAEKPGDASTLLQQATAVVRQDLGHAARRYQLSSKADETPRLVRP